MVMKRGIGDDGLKRVATKVTAQEEGYQGWKNYETWAVALWLDNDRGSYEYWRKRIQEIRDQYGGPDYDYEESEYWTPHEKIKFTIADELREHHEEIKPDLSDVFGDLLHAALSEVNWDEIAEHLSQEV